MDSSKEINLIEEKSSPKIIYIILGWIAGSLSYLVLQIGTKGQEIVSYGYDPGFCGKQPIEDLKRDLILDRMLLEDIIGISIYGYRAPSFSLSPIMFWKY
jgi:hypothetical protein